jgi:hypothetical protein
MAEMSYCRLVAELLRRLRLGRQLGASDQRPVFVQAERHHRLVDLESVLGRLATVQKVRLVAQRQGDPPGHRVSISLDSLVSLTGAADWARDWRLASVAMARKDAIRLIRWTGALGVQLRAGAQYARRWSDRGIRRLSEHRPACSAGRVQGSAAAGLAAARTAGW